MGSSLSGILGNNNSGQQPTYGYGPELQCCDAVVDPLSLFGAIGAITAVSLFLRQQVIDNMVMGPGRKKKRSLGQDLNTVFEQGTFSGKPYTSDSQERNLGSV